MLCIEKVLRSKGMTQGDLAKMLGVSVQAVNSVLCGRCNPSRRLIKRYADTLDVPIESLYDDLLSDSL